MAVTTSDGAPGARLISAALSAFPPEISYVRAEVGRRRQLVPVGRLPEDGEWLHCAELIANPAWLEELIAMTGRALGTDDRVVAASLFVQNYSYRVLMTAIACMTTAAVVPDGAADKMAVTLSNGRPHIVAYTEPKALVLAQGDEPAAVLADRGLGDSALGFLLERAVDEHIAPLIASTRARSRVGRRLLWGNVAASAATAFRTMDGCLGRWVQPLGERFFAIAPPPLQGLGSFLALEHEGKSAWYWERTNCCLHDRLPAAIRCGDCSRTPSGERRAAYRAALMSEPESQ